MRVDLGMWDLIREDTSVHRERIDRSVNSVETIGKSAQVKKLNDKNVRNKLRRLFTTLRRENIFLKL